MPSLRSIPDGSERPRFCSRCAEPLIVADALYCKRCGCALLQTGSRVPPGARNPVVAAILSVVPGLGHLYKGQALAAFMWFFAVGIAYLAQPLGAMLHLVCVANAGLGGSTSDRRAALP